MTESHATFRSQRSLLRTVVLALVLQNAAATPSIQVLTPADNAHLMELAHRFQTDANDEDDNTFCQYVTADANALGRRVGVAVLDQELGLGLKQAAGINPFAPEAAFSSLQQTGTHIRSVCSVLTQSSALHADSLRQLPAVSDDPEYFSPTPVTPDQRAAFVFLESNPDAYFSWGDRSFPVEQGNMLVFDGSVPHQTMVQKGTVKLLGPFDVATFRLVGFLDGLLDGLLGGNDIAGSTTGSAELPASDLPASDIPDLGGLGLPGGNSEISQFNFTDRQNFITNGLIAVMVVVIGIVAGVLTATAVGVL